MGWKAPRESDAGTPRSGNDVHLSPPELGNEGAAGRARRGAGQLPSRLLIKPGGLVPGTTTRSPGKSW